MTTVIPRRRVSHVLERGAALWIAAAALLAVTCLLPRSAAAQEDGLHIGAGLGLPELLNGGLHYRSGLFEAGASFGFNNAGDTRTHAGGGDLFYHFNGYDQPGNPNPWYLRVGAYYMKDEGDDLIHKYVYGSVRVGHDFELAERFLVKLDAGAIGQIWHEEIEKPSYDPLFGGLNMNIPVAPSFGVKILYRL